MVMSGVSTRFDAIPKSSIVRRAGEIDEPSDGSSPRPCARRRPRTVSCVRTHRQTFAVHCIPTEGSLALRSGDSRLFDHRFPIKQPVSDSLVHGLCEELGGDVAAMRCSPAESGWHLDFLSAAGVQATRGGECFTQYIVSAPPDWTLWNPTNIAPALRNTVQVVDNRTFSEVDVVRRVYVPLGLDRLQHLTLLASVGPRFLGWIGLWREEPFTQVEIARLSVQATAIRERLMTIDDLGAAAVSWAIVESALEAMERPAFLVRSPNRVELANARARALLKNSRRTMLTLITRVLAGETSDWTVSYFTDVGMPDMAIVSQRPGGATFERIIEHARRSWGLSATQVAVLRLVARGFSNKEIAAHLGRAEGTVELHISAIFKRANVESRARLQAKLWQALET